MKRFILTAVAVFLSGQALGASVNIFGRVDIGGLPTPPVLVVPHPVIVERGPVEVVREPVYLHVPSEHRRHWSRHCREYDACGQQVYFVQDNWYNRVYVPHHEGRGHEDHDRREYRGPDRDERRDDRHDHDRHDGPDHGRGHHERH